MEKLKLASTLLVIIFFIAAATLNRRRRKLQRKMCCYLASDESKPQCCFKHVLADNSYGSFKHLNKTEEDSNSHPYEKEISNLLENPEIEDLRFVSSEMNFALKGNYVWVDKEEQLRHLLEVLSKETVFAVDTEQHSLRSFLGFTALMQISTQAEDYLVDTIALHDVVGILHPVFANPKICKVFHGADNDVIWLQRDFHIYVVNLFDTAKACEVLSKPHRSLAYLLEAYCGVATNKVLQREDWRLRPLSEEMIQYARTDTHYLLYIADRMASELKAQYTGKPDLLSDKFHVLLEARRLSNRVCLKRYTKEVESSPGNSAASSILSRYLNGPYVSLKFETKELVEWWCMWRDTMARVHDESLRYVLSDEAIVALAIKAPKTEAEIYNTISEADSNSHSILPSPSPVVLSHLENICCYLNNNLDDVIQKHLGPSGSCPLSIYNYALLLNKSNLIQVSDAKQNGVEVIKMFGKKKVEPKRRKSRRYVRHNLAKFVDTEDGQAIMLCFEPKGAAWVMETKKNICVGCGEEGKKYFRFSIVPSCYKKHFPEHLKNSDPPNNVLVCGDCEQIAVCARGKLKSRISDELGVPDRTPAADYGGGRSAEIIKQADLFKAAFTLLYRGSNLPAERKEKLTQEVMNFYGGREVSEEDLKRALLIGMTPNDKARLKKKYGIFIEGEPGQLPNGKGVVDHILKESGEDGIREFCQRWRQMFVEALQPRCLPHDWGVDRL